MTLWVVLETEAARSDLEDALAYVAESLGSPRAALELLDRYGEVVTLLESLPEGFARVRDDTLCARGYRWAPVGSYVAFFTLDEAGHVVYVERFLHGSRNWRGLLE